MQIHAQELNQEPWDFQQSTLTTRQLVAVVWKLIGFPLFQFVPYVRMYNVRMYAKYLNLIEYISTFICITIFYWIHLSSRPSLQGVQLLFLVTSCSNLQWYTSTCVLHMSNSEQNVHASWAHWAVCTHKTTLVLSDLSFFNPVWRRENWNDWSIATSEVPDFVCQMFPQHHTRTNIPTHAHTHIHAQWRPPCFELNYLC